jgi:hypothetical protein
MAMIDSRERVYECDDPIFADALRRVKAEYLEMPGLQLTPAQAARLWALDGRLCESVLTALVEARFLIRTRAAAFVRVP